MKNKPSNNQPKKRNIEDKSDIDKGKNKGKKKKKQYKVRNWKEYNEALVNRGRAMFWITEEAMKNWGEKEKSKKRGKPRLYSDIAIETALILQQVFHLPLRQTEGFLSDILKKLGLEITSPDYSTLSIRSEGLPVNLKVRQARENIHIVVDSTGAKVRGEGEWKVRQHGWSKRRTWRKLHIGVDESTGEILLSEVTGNDKADCEMLEPLLEQLPANISVSQISGDGGYDKRTCYEAIKRRNIGKVAIPPRHDARISRHGNFKGEPLIRDENLRRIRSVGRKKWKEESNYHRRSLVETTMFRLKTIFTDKVRSVKQANQRVQLLLRCKALNLMTTLGMPDSYVVA